MSETSTQAPAFTLAALSVDAGAETNRIAARMRDILRGDLRKRGFVIGISGGIDSAVCAALAVRAVGSGRVFGLLMPEHDSDPESRRLGEAVAETFGIEHAVEDIGPALDAMGCYRRRDDAIRQVVPDYGAGWSSKIVFDNALTAGGCVKHADSSRSVSAGGRTPAAARRPCASAPSAADRCGCAGTPSPSAA